MTDFKSVTYLIHMQYNKERNINMTTIEALIILTIVSILLILPNIGIKWERKDFNNGICPNCGDHLRNFDTDSHGGRGYTCNTCEYTTWVSYKRIDKNHIRINN